MATNTYLFIVIALIAGATIPMQGSVNNKLADVLDTPILAAFVSFVVGTVSLLIFVVVSGTGFGNLTSIRNAPPIALVGGVLGAFFVTASVMLIPKLGVALTFSLIVAGQMVFTLIIDHFGLLGVPVREVSIARILGIALITAGVVLIRKF